MNYKKFVWWLSSKPPKQTKPVENGMGLIPRSIFRTLQRFFIQMFTNSQGLILKEFEVSQYQVKVAFQCFLSLILVPLFVTALSKNFVIIPLTEHFWNTQQKDIFLTSYLEKKALVELQEFDEEMYFDYFLSPINYEKPIWAFYRPEMVENGLQSTSPEFTEIFTSKFQKKTLDLVTRYNQKSIDSLTNLFSDFISFGTLVIVIVVLKVQITILKSFLIEICYSLTDTTRSFLLIFISDLLVGFHSPRGWEFLLEVFLSRFGLPPNETFISLFVAIFPVMLDTVFKYWIFRYLNKIAPSTVATYHAMIE